MLVLTRKIGESIVIADLVYCTFVGFRYGEARIAIDAPRSIPVFRDEIQQCIKHSHEEAFWTEENGRNNHSVVDRLITTFKEHDAAQDYHSYRT